MPLQVSAQTSKIPCLENNRLQIRKLFFSKRHFIGLVPLTRAIVRPSCHPSCLHQISDFWGPWNLVWLSTHHPTKHGHCSCCFSRLPAFDSCSEVLDIEQMCDTITDQAQTWLVCWDLRVSFRNLDSPERLGNSRPFLSLIGLRDCW